MAAGAYLSKFLEREASHAPSASAWGATFARNHPPRQHRPSTLNSWVVSMMGGASRAGPRTQTPSRFRGAELARRLARQMQATSPHRSMPSSRRSRGHLHGAGGLRRKCWIASNRIDLALLSLGRSLARARSWVRARPTARRRHRGSARPLARSATVLGQYLEQSGRTYSATAINFARYRVADREGFARAPDRDADRGGGTNKVPVIAASAASGRIGKVLVTDEGPRPGRASKLIGQAAVSLFSRTFPDIGTSAVKAIIVDAEDFTSRRSAEAPLSRSTVRKPLWSEQHPGRLGGTLAGPQCSTASRAEPSETDVGRRQADSAYRAKCSGGCLDRRRGSGRSGPALLWNDGSRGRRNAPNSIAAVG